MEVEVVNKQLSFLDWFKTPKFHDTNEHQAVVYDISEKETTWDSCSDSDWNSYWDSLHVEGIYFLKSFIRALSKSALTLFSSTFLL